LKKTNIQPTLNPKLDRATRTVRPEGLAALLKAVNECQVNKIYQNSKIYSFILRASTCILAKAKLT
jgi:hypothetical protein